MFRRNPTGVSGMSPWSQYSGSKRGLRQKGFVEKEGFKPRCVRMDDTIRYDTRCYFNVRSKADISQLNLPHGTNN